MYNKNLLHFGSTRQNLDIQEVICDHRYRCFQPMIYHLGLEHWSAPGVPDAHLQVVSFKTKCRIRHSTSHCHLDQIRFFDSSQVTALDGNYKPWSIVIFAKTCSEPPKHPRNKANDLVTSCCCCCCCCCCCKIYPPAACWKYTKNTWRKQGDGFPPWFNPFLWKDKTYKHVEKWTKWHPKQPTTQWPFWWPSLSPPKLHLELLNVATSWPWMVSWRAAKDEY